MHHNGKCSTDNYVKAQLFNEYFYSVFTRTISPHRINAEYSQPTKFLHTIDIQYMEVFEAVVSLDSNKAMGIDGISPKILKYCTTSLCEPITFLCLQLGYLPQEWCTHCITPIYKTVISRLYLITVLSHYYVLYLKLSRKLSKSIQ